MAHGDTCQDARARQRSHAATFEVGGLVCVDNANVSVRNKSLPFFNASTVDNNDFRATSFPSALPMTGRESEELWTRVANEGKLA